LAQLSKVVAKPDATCKHSTYNAQTPELAQNASLNGEPLIDQLSYHFNVAIKLVLCNLLAMQARKPKVFTACVCFGNLHVPSRCDYAPWRLLQNISNKQQHSGASHKFRRRLTKHHTSVKVIFCQARYSVITTKKTMDEFAKAV